MEETDNDVLNDILKKVAKEQQYNDYDISVKPISSGGANYTSYLYQASISSPGKDDLQLFVKVAAVGEKMRGLSPLRIFEIESFFYNKMLKIYQELEEKHNVPTEHRLRTPKFYASNDELNKEALVLEDMTAVGYQSFDRFKTIDWNYAAKSIQNLGRLHALSIAWSLEDPDEFKKTETLKSESNVASLVEFLKNIVKNAVGAAKPENKDRLSKFLEKMTVYEEFQKHFRPIRRTVIAHGDYRPSNLLHRVHSNGEVDIISVDYQTLNTRNPIIDLIYFIFTGSDKEFRKHHLKATIERYYMELCDALRRLDLDPNEVYSREDFDYELDKILPFGLVISVLCLLVVTVQEEDAPKVGQDTEINDFAVSPNDLYKERLNDIIDDYIDMGLL